MAIEFTESAGKHGFTQEDAVWAMIYARYVEPEFDEPRIPEHVRPTLYVGLSFDSSAPSLEVMVEVLFNRTIVVFHVMKARPKYLDRMDSTIEEQTEMTQTKDYNAAAGWAEDHDVPETNWALRGDVAAAYARKQLQEAGVPVPVPVGRPRLDPAEKNTGRSPRRQVRLPQELSDDPDHLAAQKGCGPSVIMRDAIANYLDAHRRDS